MVGSGKTKTPEFDLVGSEKTKTAIERRSRRKNAAQEKTSHEISVKAGMKTKSQSAKKSKRKLKENTSDVFSQSVQNAEEQLRRRNARPTRSSSRKH